ncbi:hypothetical protein ACFT8P_33950 [Streptomyces sp. NPDC057101]|uniref:hypothetical protein n=1 Tax=Streptomyces sp. NPDC057101 TaxID=3346020 RepID=UPI003642AE22
MEHRHKRRSRWRSLPFVGLLVAALVLALYGVGLLDQRTVSAAPNSAQLLSTGDGQNAAAGGAAPQVSSDGRYAVFESGADLPALTPLHPRSEGNTRRVYARDLRTGAVTLLSDPSVDATAPQVSADGRVVTYRASASGGELSTRTSTVVVDRDVDGRKTFDQAGNVEAYDLDDAPGATASSFPGLCASDCGPRISDDGTKVVRPSVLSAVSPYLEITAAEGRTEPTTTVLGNVVNFDGMVSSAYNGFEADNEDYTVTIGTRSLLRGKEKEDLTGRPVLENTAPDSTSPAFTLGGKTCDTDGKCRVEVTFHPSSACAGSPSGVSFGRLRTSGATPAGQTAIALVARCRGPISAPWCASGPDLTQQQMADLPLRLGSVLRGSNERRGNVVPVGSALPGSPFITVVPVSVSGEFTFSTDDCSAIRLVDPGPQLRARAENLKGGALEPILVGQSGVVDGALYLLIAPEPRTDETAVRGTAHDGPRIHTARLSVNSGGSNQLPPNGLSIAVQVERRVIEMRKDTASTPGFAPGPATVVNVADTGGSGTTIIDGVQPALSGDGQTLLFARPVLPETPPDESAVLRASLSDDTAGPATVVAGGDGDAVTAPAVSRDGKTLAFVRGPRTASPARPTQVVVTDAHGKDARVVSTNADGTPGDGDSDRPALSPDGKAVGFASKAPGLGTATGTTAPRLFVRALSGDDTLIAVASLGAGEGPAVAFDAQATRAYFTSRDPLTEGDTNAQDDAYAQRLPGRLIVAPTGLDFGVYDKPSPAGVGLPLSLTNAGPGTVTIDAVTAPAPFQAQGTCTGRTLAAGETCVTVVSFTPTSAGTYEGVVEVQGNSGPPRAQQTARTTLRAEVQPAPTAPDTDTPAPPPPTFSDAPPAPATTGPAPSPSPSPPPGPTPSPSPGAPAPGSLSIVPSVAHPGRVTRVHGRGFTPDTTVNLTWGTTGPTQPVTVTSTGDFTAYVPVGRTATPTLGTITAADADGRLLAYVQFLVEKLSMEPSLIGRGGSGS